ncbi:hypothetical protein R5R35_010153 [Gryllus longicercus]|uniref:DNA/RNA non-specific endonuclease n=1 Tax=Gryllus longicercus TaxID=2509291 RepID=A0AAN9Z3C0_9ORTH
MVPWKGFADPHANPVSSDAQALAFQYIANNSDYYLARGHMVAKADFVWAQQQRATFYYINAAPQWQTFNGGNWERLESSVRRLAATRERDLLVITGAWGRARLPHASGKPADLFVNAQGLIPVPALYWKVVFDSSTGEGAAFVGVNNPYTTLAGEPRLALCKDVCASIDWVSWAPDSVKAGEGYCCEVDALRAAIPDVPQLKVSALLAKA